MTKWNRTGAAASLVLVTLAFYHGLWLPGRVLIARDAPTLFVPVKEYLIARLEAGELPEWFPYEGLGRPFIGAAVTGVFHPLNILYFLFPVDDAYRFSILLSCLLAALGSLALARVLALSWWGGVMSGVAFALSGYVASLTETIQYIYSLGVLPLFCLGLEKALAARQAWVVAPAVVWATVFLNGDLQTAYYYGFVALLWAAMRGQSSYRVAGLRLLTIGILTALLAGIQLGPAAATFAQSGGPQSSFGGVPLTWSLHPRRLLTMVAAPIELGNTAASAPGELAGTWAESVYVGVPVVGLAVLGILHRPDLRIFGVLAASALLLALGRFGFLYGVFSQVVPLWSAFRYPEKLVGLVVFALTPLAGAGVDAMRAGKGGPAAWLVLGGLLGVLALAFHSGSARAWAPVLLDAPRDLGPALAASAARACAASALVTLGVAVLALVGQRWRERGALLVLAGLIAVVILDLARVNVRFCHTAPAALVNETPPLAAAVRAREPDGPGRFRLVTLLKGVPRPSEDLRRALGERGAQEVVYRRALGIDHNARFRIESPDVYLPGHEPALQTALAAPGHVVTADVAARFNVTYYVGSQAEFLRYPRFARTLVQTDPEYGIALFGNPAAAKPRAYLSQRPERAAARVDPGALRARTDFLSGEVDVIETADAALPGPAPDGEATVESYAPEEVRVRVKTRAAAVLVLLDAFAPGWTAHLEDGTRLAILRANAVVRAVTVPAGEHVVTFSYRTPMLALGAIASLAGILLSLVLIVRDWRT